MAYVRTTSASSRPLQDVNTNNDWKQPTRRGQHGRFYKQRASTIESNNVEVSYSKNPLVYRYLDNNVDIHYLHHNYTPSSQILSKPLQIPKEELDMYDQFDGIWKSLIQNIMVESFCRGYQWKPTSVICTLKFLRRMFYDTDWDILSSFELRGYLRFICDQNHHNSILISSFIGSKPHEFLLHTCLEKVQYILLLFYLHITSFYIYKYID